MLDNYLVMLISIFDDTMEPLTAATMSRVSVRASNEGSRRFHQEGLFSLA